LYNFGILYVTLINKKRIKIKLLDRSSDKEKEFLFYLDKIHGNQKKIKPVVDKMYTMKDDSGDYHYALFLADNSVYILQTDTLNEITAKTIQAKDFRGTWNRTTGSYVTIGNITYVKSSDIQEIEMISNKEIVIDGKHLLLK